MIRHSLAVILLLLAVLASTSGVAAARTSSGSKPDARGDAPPQGDILRTSASYDSRGRLSATLSLANLADAAAHRAVVGVFFARVRGGRCDTRSGAAISFETDTKVAQAGLLPEGQPVRARARVSGNKVKLSVAGPRFARKRFNCAIVRSLVPTGPTTSKILDSLTLRLKARR
jgi:hypothetical protein